MAKRKRYAIELPHLDVAHKVAKARFDHLLHIGAVELVDEYTARPVQGVRGYLENGVLEFVDYRSGARPETVARMNLNCTAIERLAREMGKAAKSFVLPCNDAGYERALNAAG